MATQPADCQCPTQDVATLARLGAEGRLPACPRHNPRDLEPDATGPTVGLNSPELVDSLTRALNAKTDRNTPWNVPGSHIGAAHLSQTFNA